MSTSTPRAGSCRPTALQPFWRLEATRSLKAAGVGLGLAIAQSTAQPHGDTLPPSDRPEGGLRARISLLLSHSARSTE
jgi:signal transduction histidine kinase